MPNPGDFPAVSSSPTDKNSNFNSIDSSMFRFMAKEEMDNSQTIHKIPEEPLLEAIPLQTIESFLESLEREPIEKIISTYKTLMMNYQYKTEHILTATFRQFIYKLSFFHPNSLTVNDITSVRFILTLTLGNYENIFYQPILDGQISESALIVSDSLRILSFYTEILGELKLWFGMDNYMVSLDASVNMKGASGIISENKRESFMSLSEQQPVQQSQMPPTSSLQQSFNYSVNSVSKYRVRTVHTDLISLILLGKEEIMTLERSSKFRQQSIQETISKQKKFTVGQAAYIIELIWVLRRIRVALKHDVFIPEVKEPVKNALLEIERKIAVYLKLSNQLKFSLDESHQLLLMNFLLEVRLFTNVKQKPEWFPIIMSWLFDRLNLVIETNEELKNHELKECEVMKAVKFVYEMGMNISETIAAGLNFSKHCFEARINYLFSNVCDSDPISHVVLVKNHLEVLLILVIILYSFLETPDLTTLLPILWGKFGKFPSNLNTKISFLLYYCCENIPVIAKETIYRDLFHSNPLYRLGALKKMANLLTDWKYILYQAIPSEIPIQAIVSQYVAADVRNLQSAFKSVFVNLPFSQPDFGQEDNRSRNDPDWLIRYKEMAQKIRQQSADDQENELNEHSEGWDLKKEDKQRDRRFRIENQITLIQNTLILNENFNEQKFGTKMKSILPPVVSLFNIAIIDLLQDFHGPIFQMTREIIYNRLREDSFLFLRVFFYELTGSTIEKQRELFCRLRRLISLKNLLSNSFCYTLFNFCVGYLKHLFQNPDTISKPKTHMLELYSHLMSISMDLIAQVPNLSIRELKKGKVDSIMLFLGQFWFSSDLSLPENLPKHPTMSYKSIEVPKEVLETSIVKMNQILLMINFLLKNPSEAAYLRKIFGQELKKVSDWLIFDGRHPELSEYEFVFTHFHTLPLYVFYQQDKNWHGYRLISLFKRIWLQYFDLLMIFLPKQEQVEWQDWQWMISDINYCLLRFRYDQQLVQQCFRLFLNMATRFKKMFLNRGYHLFSQALFDFYLLAEKEENHFQLNAVLYALNRFYQLHQEAFLFQFLGSILPFINDENAPSLFRLFDHSSKFNIIESGINEIRLSVDLLLRVIFTVISYDVTNQKAKQFLLLLKKGFPYLKQYPILVQPFASALTNLIPLLAKISVKPSLFTEEFYQSDIIDHQDKIIIRTEFFTVLTLFLNLKELNFKLEALDYEVLFTICRNVVKDQVSLSIPYTTDWILYFTKEHMALLEANESNENTFKSFIKTLHLIYSKNQNRPGDLGPLMSAVCLMLPNPVCLPLIKERFYIPILLTPFSINQTNHEQISAFSNSFADILFLKIMKGEPLIEDLEKAHKEPSLHLLCHWLIPLGQKLAFQSFQLNNFDEKSLANAISSVVFYLIRNRINYTLMRKKEIENKLMTGASGKGVSISNLREEPQLGGIASSQIVSDNSSSSHSSDRINLENLNALLLTLKYCLLAGRQVLTNYYYHLWSRVAFFLQQLFLDESLILKHLDSIWSFLDFVVQLNSPLLFHMRSFLLTQCRWVKMHLNDPSLYRNLNVHRKSVEQPQPLSSRRSKSILHIDETPTFLKFLKRGKSTELSIKGDDLQKSATSFKSKRKNSRPSVGSEEMATGSPPKSAQKSELLGSTLLKQKITRVLTALKDPACQMTPFKRFAIEQNGKEEILKDIYQILLDEFEQLKNIEYFFIFGADKD